MFGLFNRNRTGSFGTSWKGTAAPGSARLSIERLEDRSMLGGFGLGPSPGATEITVMSQNLYLGAAIEPVIEAAKSGDPNLLVPAVSEFWAGVNFTNFPERAEMIAEEIGQWEPHLIGLQEVSLYRTGEFDSLSENPTPAQDVAFDFLEILLDELEKRGLSYAPVAVTVEADAEFPGMVAPNVYKDIRMTDRDVILARTDLPRSQMKISHVQEERFHVNLEVPIGETGQIFTVWRGWNSVDVKVDHAKFRFINTHLEAESQLVRFVQAAELLAGPACTRLSTVIVGDFNSPANRPGSSTYQLLVAAGFNDAWIETHPGDPGYTWGNEPHLLNPDPLTLDPQRIDLVLHRGGVTALSMDVVNDEQTDRTASGFWPSDHAGVVATLAVPAWPFHLPFLAARAGGLAIASGKIPPGLELPDPSGPVVVPTFAAIFQEPQAIPSLVDGGPTASLTAALPGEDSLDFLASSRTARPGLKVREVLFASTEPEDLRYELR